jgi:hypothetical protein
MTDCIYRLQYLPDGGIQWLLPKPWTSSIGQCVHRRTAGAIEMASKVVPFFVVVLFAVALAVAGVIRSK